jgi:hypothetical protein
MLRLMHQVHNREFVACTIVAIFTVHATVQSNKNSMGHLLQESGRKFLRSAGTQLVSRAGLLEPPW